MYNHRRFGEQLNNFRTHLIGNRNPGELIRGAVGPGYILPEGSKGYRCVEDSNGEWVADRSQPIVIGSDGEWVTAPDGELERSASE